MFIIKHVLVICTILILGLISKYTGMSFDTLLLVFLVTLVVGIDLKV